MLKNKKKGFTLVEIVVVIAIMVVLLAVLAPSLLRYVEDSRMQRDDSAMDEVCNSVQLAMADSETFDEVFSYSIPNNYTTYTDSSGVYGARYTDEEYWAPDGGARTVTITFNPDENGDYDLATAVVNDMTSGNGSVAQSRTTDASKICKFEDMGNQKLYAAVKKVVDNTISEQSATYRNSSYTVFISFELTDGIYRTEVYGSYNGTNLSSDSPASTGSGTYVPPEEVPDPQPGQSNANPTPDYSDSDLAGSGGSTGGTNPTPSQPTEPPHEHNYQTETTTEATCTENGILTSTCEGCGDTDTEVIPALGHIEVADAAVEPTCTATGKTAGTHCSRCNQVVKVQEIIPAKGHTEITDSATTATCTEDGLTAGSHCSVCNTVIKQPTTITALGHNLGSPVTTVAATCTTAGQTKTSCQRTGCSYSETGSIPAKGHTEVIDNAVPATCTANGKTEGKHCSVCNTVIVAQNTVNKLGHDLITDAAVDATCTKAGLAEGSHCTRCNYKVAQTTTPALGHEYNSVVTKKATCTEEGLVTYTCIRNDHSYTEVISSLGGHIDEDNDNICDTCGNELGPKMVTVTFVSAGLFASNTAVFCEMNGVTYDSTYITTNGTQVIMLYEYTIKVPVGTVITCYAATEINVKGTVVEGNYYDYTVTNDIHITCNSDAFSGTGSIEIR